MSHYLTVDDLTEYEQTIAISLFGHVLCCSQSLDNQSMATRRERMEKAVLEGLDESVVELRQSVKRRLDALSSPSGSAAPSTPEEHTSILGGSGTRGAMSK